MKGVMKIIGCLVGMVLVIWLANSITEHFFVLDLLSFVVEMILVAFYTGCITVFVIAALNILFRPIMAHLSGKQLAWCFVTILAVNLIPHIWMSWELDDLKREFKQVASTNYAIDWESGEVDGRPTNTMDFGGRLDSIINRRNQTLLENGYIPLGKWSIVQGYSPDLYMVYAPMPLPFKARKWLFNDRYTFDVLNVEAAIEKK